jgi:hypothetical protein
VQEGQTYGVRGEEGSLPGWGWEQKETDIYKVSLAVHLALCDGIKCQSRGLPADGRSNKLLTYLHWTRNTSLTRPLLPFLRAPS